MDYAHLFNHKILNVKSYMPKFLKKKFLFFIMFFFILLIDETSFRNAKIKVFPTAIFIAEYYSNAVDSEIE